MSDNWIVQNLINALNTWNSKLSEIWTLITQTPETFKGGVIWNVIKNIYGGMQAVGLALLVLFFVIGVMKSASSFNEIKRPEHFVKLLLRFILTKTVVTYGMDLMLMIFKISQGIVSKVMNITNITTANASALPDEMITTIESVGIGGQIPLWAVTLIVGLIITVLSYIMIMTVYGRFFKLYLYTALAPIPLSTFAGEPTQNVGRNFIKSYTSVCLEGVIIILSCIIFSLFASTPPVVDATASAFTQVWKYSTELIFNMLVLVGTVKLSDRVVKEMMGL